MTASQHSIAGTAAAARELIPVAEPLIGELELEYVSEAVRSGWVSSIGPFVTSFEEGIAAEAGAKHAVAVCNGTAALHLALCALGVGPGDEVVVPSLTFVATANAVRYLGAVPVFADCDPETWSVGVEQVARVVTKRTRAVVPVHLFGHPADMGELVAYAGEAGIAVVEDAAEALGAEYRGRRVGAIGDAGVFSFYGNKLITSGEGGAIVTNDDALAERVRFLRDHAMSSSRRYWHDEVGFNYRITNIQAALGCAQLRRIDEFLAAKRRIAARYLAGLEDLGGTIVQQEQEWAWSSWWMFTLALPDGVDRDEVAARLRSLHVDSRPAFVPLHLLPPYATGTSLPTSELIGATGLTLPSGVGLSDDEQTHVIGTLRSILVG